MRVAIFSGMLFLSGASALVFQTLWLRLSGLTFGNSVWSAALILSSFMGGLAIGSAIAARRQVRHFRPLRVYAVLELTIALCGIAIVFVLPHAAQWLRPIYSALWSQQGLLSFLRFAFCFAVLLIPTTAMGLTLPIVLEDDDLRQTHFGSAVGLLYGANTVGAVAGAVAGEAYLIAAFGLFGTSIAAAALNCGAAAVAVLLARPNNSQRAVDTLPPPPIRSRALPWRLCVVSFGCGAILLCLELVWLRFLRLYVASSATAFATMLAVVLTAIALGGFTASVTKRLIGCRYTLPVLLLAASTLTILSYAFFPVPRLERGEEFYYVERWRQIALLAIPLMAPVSWLSGMLFTAVTAGVQERLISRMNSAGIVTLFNTVGATIGPLVATFVFLPGLGFQSTLLICAAVYAVLALLSIDPAQWPWRRVGVWTVAALGVLCVGTFVFFPYHRDAVHFANARRLYEVNGLQLVKISEGTSDTFQLMRRQLFGGTYYYRLLTNAYSMSATNPANQRYMRLSAYLPRLFDPEARTALLIAYGVGVTADALVRGEQLSHIDVVDISKEVFELSPLHSDSLNPDPLTQAKVSPVVQDGRFFLQASPRKYDIITGEPPPPKVAGTVSLYTQEFFSLLAQGLNPGGIATFWLPIYQLRVSEAKAILVAFHSAFPNASVWASSDEEWIMLGINGPARPLNQQEFRRLWHEPSTGDDLRRIGLELPEQTAALFVMDGDEIDRITQGVAPLTDFYPKRLSDAPSDTQAIHEFAWPYVDASKALPRFQSSALVRRIWPEALMQALDPYFVARETRYLARVTATNPFAELDLYFRHSKLRTPVLEILGSDNFRLQLAERFAQRESDAPTDALHDLIAGALADRDASRAAQLLQMLIARGAADPDDLLLLTYVYCVSGDVKRAEQFAREHATALPHSGNADWLWKMLQADFGFHPPS